MDDEFTIEELVECKKDFVKDIEDSFKALDSIYNATESNRKVVVNELRTKSALIYLKYFIRSVFNTDLSIEIENLVGKLLKNAKTAQEEKELLIAIKKSVVELKKYELAECNDRLTKLLMLLFEKNILLLKQGQNYINTTMSRMKRLDVVEGTREADKIQKIDEKVDALVLSLGLKK